MIADREGTRAIITRASVYHTNVRFINPSLAASSRGVRAAVALFFRIFKVRGDDNTVVCGRPFPRC